MKLYYTVKEIKEMEGCGKDEAYKIAVSLPHERRGGKGRTGTGQIFVFAEAYKNYYEKKKAVAFRKNKKNNEEDKECYQKHYQMRKLG